LRVHGFLGVVLVVGADPELEPIALVAAFRRPVEDRVVAHQELDPASSGRIGVVDDPVVQDEGAEALALGQVPDKVGAGLAGVAAGDRRQLLEYRRDPLARLLFAAREAEVNVEVTARRRHPGKTPAYPPLVRLQLLQRLWVPVIRFASCGLPVLMDQSTKSIPPHNPASRQDSSRFAGPQRRHPSQATMRTVHVS
jgi:hypothetical protein